MYHQKPTMIETDSDASAKPETLYFAYGSNLGFKQMATRCPSSVFVGRARLHNYEFQINERGYANVIPSQDPTSFVDGLCYRLSSSDEECLDLNEGVPFAYQKCLLEVEFWYAKADLVGRTVANIVACHEHTREGEIETSMPGLDNLTVKEENQHGDAERVCDTEPEDRPRHKHSEQLAKSTDKQIEHGGEEENAELSEIDRHAEAIARGQGVMAMVYLSTTYTQRGLPWDEYICRMNTGFDEAVRLGISQQYVRNCVEAFLVEAKDD